MNRKKSLEFIINPISGTHNKVQISALIEELTDKDQFDYRILKTEFAGHAAQLANQAALRGVDIVVAVGGDGTVNEVARSLIHTGTALGIIPCGSGNGLARHLEIPLDTTKAIRLINRCSIKNLDYGKINNYPFFCTCGIGFDAFVSHKFAESGKRGLLTYLENTLREGLKYKPLKYVIENENGREHYKAFLIACANASQYGNNAYIAPSASMSDGLIDVIIMEPFTILEAPQIVFQLFNRQLDKNSHIKTFRCKKLIIHREEEGVVHFDGDPIITGKDVEIEVVEKGLRVLVNEEVKKEVTNKLQMFTEFFSDLSSIGDELVEINKAFLKKNKDFIKKLTK